MNINRYNYEEYFILYMDNELDSETRREVETFAEANPDLKAELDMLMQSKLAPDTTISFADKDSLMRFRDSSVSLNNYEEWLIAYIDNELSPEERKDAENFIAGNPSIQRELNLLQRVKLQPEAIVFPYKESLYRREEKARVIAISWRRIAVAAALLLAISTTAILLINNNKGNGGGGSVASKTGEPETSTSSTVSNKKKDGTTLTGTEQLTNDTDKKDNDADKKNDEAKKDQLVLTAKKQNNDNKPEEKKQQVEQVKDKELAYVPNEDKPTNNLPIKTIETIVGNEKSEPTDVASTTKGNGEKTLTTPETKTGDETVTTETANPYNNQTASENTKDNPAAKFASNNNKGGGVRGFLRKVTRTFEKRTNIKATDDDDRLLVAGLAIKL